MLKKICIVGLILISINSFAQPNAFNNIIEQKYGCGDSCIKNVCTDNVLCKIYSNQNMCALQASIPKELQNLSYVIYPTQFNEYNTARFNFNKRFNIFPHAIIKPTNASQVAYSISIMRKHSLEFAVRAGGHCYGPGSLSSGYVIDVSNFNNIITNVEKKEVFFGAGCVLGSVIQTLGNINFAIPTGTCPSVGITGLSLGGGIGLLARPFGLTSDSIKSITMVDANSKVIEVTATNKYSDLFWALCGGGNGSYGVVIGFTFKMHYLPKVTLVKLKFEWDLSNIFELFHTWQSWIKTLPDDISSEFNFIYRSGKLGLSINSVRANSKPFNQWKIFEKFNPTIKIINGSYLDCAKEIASNYTQPFSKAKSKFIFQALTNQAVQVIIDHFDKLKAINFPILMFAEFGAGGGKLAQGDSAYFPRNAFLYNFQFTYWNFETQSNESLASANSFYNAFAPYTSPYSYSNLVDFDLGDTYLNAYYGTHVNRLIKVKNKYDPLNLFKWKQSIPLKK